MLSLKIDQLYKKLPVFGNFPVLKIPVNPYLKPFFLPALKSLISIQYLPCVKKTCFPVSEPVFQKKNTGKFQ